MHCSGQFYSLGALHLCGEVLSLVGEDILLGGDKQYWRKLGQFGGGSFRRGYERILAVTSAEICLVERLHKPSIKSVASFIPLP